MVDDPTTPRALGSTIAVVLVVVFVVVTTVALVRAWVVSLPPLAFAALTEYRQYDVAVAKPDGLALLTNDKLSYSPVWSPDGSRIAYLRGEPDSWEECCGYGGVDLWVMNSDGSNAHAVTEGAGPGSPQWLPDSRSVVFLGQPSEQPAPEGLVELDLASGEITEFLPRFSPESSDGWSLSPDGTQVVSADVMRGQILIFDVTDGEQTVVADGVFANATEVKWSPDGEWLVMEATARGVDDGGIWAWNLEDEQKVQVSATTWVNYAWVGGNTVFTCREIGIGDSEEGLTAQLFVTTLEDTDASTEAVDGYDAITNDGQGCISEEISARVPR